MSRHLICATDFLTWRPGQCRYAWGLLCNFSGAIDMFTTLFPILAKFESIKEPVRMPDSVQPKAKLDIQEIRKSPTKKEALKAIDHFVGKYGAKYEKRAHA